MNTFIYLQTGLNVVFLGFVIYLLYAVRKYKHYMPIIMDAAKIVTEDPLPVDPRLIEEWKAKRKSLPEGSDDWVAYSRRLVRAGVLREVF